MDLYELPAYLLDLFEGKPSQLHQNKVLQFTKQIREDKVCTQEKKEAGDKVDEIKTILCSESWVYGLAEPDIRDQDNKYTYLKIEQWYR